MQETIHVNLAMNERVTRVDEPCTIRLCFDEHGTACVRVIKQNGDVVEIPVFRSINFAKELVI